MIFKNFFKRQDDSVYSSIDDPLDSVVYWVDQLYIELSKRDGDKEFVTDMLISARKNFSDNFNDDQKADAFVYLLGLLCNKR